MLGILSGLFKKENSKDEAKNRLKLVLIQDRVNVTIWSFRKYER